jgi:hypothetical protein
MSIDNYDGMPEYSAGDSNAPQLLPLTYDKSPLYMVS